MLISHAVLPPRFSQLEKCQGVKLTSWVPALLQLHWKDTRQVGAPGSQAQMRFRTLNKWKQYESLSGRPKDWGLVMRGETHFPTAHELVSYLDEAQRGKHVHEETAPWVFEGSIRKEAHDPTVHLLQTAHPRSEALPRPEGNASATDI